MTPAPLRGERMHTVSDFTVKAGERVPFVLTWAPSHVRRPRSVDAEEPCSMSTERFWRELVGQVQGLRAVQGRRAALADHPQGPDLRAHRRHRGGRNHVAAGADRRAAELGLPLLLAPRCHPDAAGAARRRLHRRGGRPGATGCCGPWPGTLPTCRSCTGIHGERRLPEMELPWLSGI